jgi:hypothetical protein
MVHYIIYPSFLIGKAKSVYEKQSTSVLTIALHELVSVGLNIVFGK